MNNKSHINTVKLIGPGMITHKSAMLENIGMYRHAIITKINPKGKITFDQRDIEFDIERHVHLRNKNDPICTYGFMLNGYYALGAYDKEEFIEKINKIHGFARDSASNNTLEQYINLQKNTIANWKESEKEIRVGLVQLNLKPTLQELMEDVPYTIGIYKQLNPKREIPIAQIQQILATAQHNDNYLLGKKVIPENK